MFLSIFCFLSNNTSNIRCPNIGDIRCPNIPKRYVCHAPIRAVRVSQVKGSNPLSGRWGSTSPLMGHRVQSSPHPRGHGGGGASCPLDNKRDGNAGKQINIEKKARCWEWTASNKGTFWAYSDSENVLYDKKKIEKKSKYLGQSKHSCPVNFFFRSHCFVAKNISRQTSERCQTIVIEIKKPHANAKHYLFFVESP